VIKSSTMEDDMPPPLEDEDEIRLSMERTENFAENALTLLMITWVIVYTGTWFYRRRRLATVVVGGWILHLAYALTVGNVTQDEMLDRLENVYFTTHTFLDAGLKMMLAWLAVVAPLVTDLGFVSVKAWAQLDNVQRAAACATLLVIWGLLKGVAKARQHQDAIKDLAYQALFFIVGPAMWYGLAFVKAEYMAYLLPGMTTLAPALLSTRAYIYEERYEKPHHRKWLSYWTCWPTIQWVTNLAMMFASDTKQLNIFIMVVLVWLQHWEGSRHIPDLVLWCYTSIAKPVVLLALKPLPAIPGWYTIMTKYGGAVGKVTQVYTLVKEKPYLGMPVAAVVAYIFFKVFSTASDLLTQLVVWGVCVQTTEVVTTPIKTQFKPKLAFWIIAMMFELMVRVPVLGHFAALWRPVLLGPAYFFGETILNYVFGTTNAKE